MRTTDDKRGGIILSSFSYYPHRQIGQDKRHYCPPEPHHNALPIFWARDIGYYIARGPFGVFKVQIEFCPFCGSHLPGPCDGPGRETEMAQAREEWNR